MQPPPSTRPALFSRYGIGVPAGEPAVSSDEAVEVAKSLGGDTWVVKAQAHTGGRGKAGGVQLVRSLEAVRSAAEEMIGMTLVTRQTGPEGLPVQKVLRFDRYVGLPDPRTTLHTR